MKQFDDDTYETFKKYYGDMSSKEKKRLDFLVQIYPQLNDDRKKEMKVLQSNDNNVPNEFKDIELIISLTIKAQKDLNDQDVDDDMYETFKNIYLQMDSDDKSQLNLLLMYYDQVDQHGKDELQKEMLNEMKGLPNDFKDIHLVFTLLKTLQNENDEIYNVEKEFKSVMEYMKQNSNDDDDDPVTSSYKKKIITRTNGREKIIQKGEITDIKIRLETSEDVNDFIKNM